MDKKGFAISSIVYAILILFLALIAGILGLLGSRKLILDKLKNDVMDELNNKEVVSNLYKDNSGASIPELYNNMIPIMYVDGNWVYADIYSSWYDYDLKQWANAVVLNSGVTKNVGDIITESDIALWYVWIPRYKYKIFTDIENVATGTDYNINNAQVIDVVFESKMQNKSNGTTKGSYLTHPAFTFGDRELDGIWVGKFESSNKENLSNDDSNLTLTIKPNVPSWRNIKISNAFIVSRNAAVIYNLNTSDSHVIKNIEWGAVSYLSSSKYGQGSTEVRINNSSTYMTGCSATIQPTKPYLEYPLQTNNTEGYYNGCENEYNTSVGVLASTTGNITGIYDMSGGVWEYVMGVLEDKLGSNIPASSRNQLYNSGFTGNFTCPTCDNLDGTITRVEGIPFPETKYYDIYPYKYSHSDLATYKGGHLGDATIELGNFSGYISQGETMTRYYSSFNNDYAGFVIVGNPWFIRGGTHYDGTGAGVFAFSSNYGIATHNVSFRTVLVSK